MHKLVKFKVGAVLLVLKNVDRYTILLSKMEIIFSAFAVNYF